MGVCDSCTSKNETKNKPTVHPIIDKKEEYPLKNNSRNFKSSRINYNQPLKNSFIAKNQLDNFGNSFQNSKRYIPKQNHPLVINVEVVPFTVDYSRKLGTGIFSNIYAGTLDSTKEAVAVKIQQKNKYNYVSNEIMIYKKLNGLEGIPKIYWSGNYHGNDTIVMQVLGKSVQKHFYNRNKKLALWEIKDIGIQALNILESIHNRGIVHGDIKPSCFYLGLNENFKIYLADFGFAFGFNNNLTGNHKPFKKGVYSFADPKFCSKNCCRNYQKSRRDDIESLGYILVYLMKGFLPWESSNNALNIKQIKLSTSLNDLCSGISSNIKEFIRYSWNLKFYEKPNYNHLRDLLNNFNLIYVPKIKFNEIKTKENSLSEESFKQMTNKEFDKESRNTNSFIENEDLKIIERYYTKNKNSQVFNNKLRMFGPMALSEEDIKLYNALMRAINSNRTKENYIVHRFVRNDYLENTFNFKPSFDIYYNLMMITSQIGSRKIEKGFMSCYMTENHFIVRNILLEIKIPKGTRAYITRNKEESEIILPCNTEYEVTGAEVINNIIKIYITIINYDENNSDLFSNLSKPNIATFELLSHYL
jgi:serine/threonine protein kinase